MKEAFKHALAHGRGLRLGKTITLGLILGSAVMPSVFLLITAVPLRILATLPLRLTAARLSWT